MQYIREIKDKHASMIVSLTMGTLQVGNWYSFGGIRGMYLGTVKGIPVYASGKRRNDKAHALREWVLACKSGVNPRVAWENLVEPYKFDDMPQFFA